MNILITSAGRRVSLVNYFQKHLKQYFPKATVLTTDCCPELSSACQISDKTFPICKNSSPHYIEELLIICRENDVPLLIPTLDTELAVLSAHRKRFAEIGTTCVVSNFSTIKTFSNKENSAEEFQNLGIKTIEQWDFDHIPDTFPIYIKPKNGSSSIDNHVVRSKEELELFCHKQEDYLFQQYLSPEQYDEYTIDLYFNRKSTLKCAVPRKRIEVRGGEVSKAQTVRDKDIDNIVKKLDQRGGFRGPITFQVFKSKHNNDIIAIEINPRFGGGYPLTELSGAHYTRWIIEEYLLKQDIRYFDQWQDGKLMLRYDSEIFV